MKKNGGLGFQKILLVSHVTDLSGPTEAAEEYLKNRVPILDVICHPLHYCEDRRSRIARYQKGQAIIEKRRFGWALPSVFTFFRDVFFTLFFFISFRRRYDLYLGVDPLNTFVGIFLKRLGFIKAVSFYTIDWTPKRFDSKLLNYIYHSVDRFCVNNCDFAWNLSEKIVEIRKNQGLQDPKNLLVPVGVALEKIDLPEAATKKRVRKLALLGAMAPSKGVDLVIEAYEKIKEECPDIELYVIGKTPNETVEDGVAYDPYEPRLQALGKSVKLLGVLPHDEVLRRLPEFDIGLALYKPNENSFSAWADPSRVKDYLACGLPVIITDVPPIAREIDKAGAGLVIDFKVEDLVQSVVRLVKHSEEFHVMRENALALIKKYRWDHIFTEALAHSWEKRTGR